ncbi:copia protein [Trifolium pratense]|uniref:Copia protein n=1 Tax=Trifolium pratense TaxID=57577 RepID=A0A2K3NBD6_TRIPR|nr:copia protein [Trifolium pratense]
MAPGFEIKGKENMVYKLHGMEFSKLKDGIVTHQQKYIGELLDKFEMNSCKSISNPSETNSKLDEYIKEEKVDSTMFRQMVDTLRFHFIGEKVMNEVIEVVYCPTEEQLADGFTKAVKLDRFEYLRKQLSIRTFELKGSVEV